MLKFLHACGELQTHFADVLKGHLEVASPPALSLIGWIEHAPKTLLCALSRLGKEMWSDRVHIQSHTVWNCRTLSTGKTSPAYVVSFVPRPLPKEQFDKLMTRHQITFTRASHISDSLPSLLVSNGVTRALILQNLKYLIDCFKRREARLTPSASMLHFSLPTAEGPAGGKPGEWWVGNSFSLVFSLFCWLILKPFAAQCSLNKPSVSARRTPTMLFNSLHALELSSLTFSSNFLHWAAKAPR
jgi:hypothetical protein